MALSSTPCLSFDILVGRVHCILLLAFVLTFIALFLVFSDGAKRGVELELPLEGVDLGHHGHNLFIVRRFGSPLTLLLEPVKLGLGSDHKSLVGGGK